MNENVVVSNPEQTNQELTMQQRWTMINEIIFKFMLFAGKLNYFVHKNQISEAEKFISQAGLQEIFENLKSKNQRLGAKDLVVLFNNEIVINNLYQSFIEFATSTELDFKRKEELEQKFLSTIEDNIKPVFKSIVNIGLNDCNIPMHVAFGSSNTPQKFADFKNKVDSYIEDTGRELICSENINAMNCARETPLYIDEETTLYIDEETTAIINDFFKKYDAKRSEFTSNTAGQEALTNWILNVSIDKADSFVAEIHVILKELNAPYNSPIARLFRYMLKVKNIQCHINQTKIQDKGSLTQQVDDKYEYSHKILIATTSEINATFSNEMFENPDKLKQIMNMLSNEEFLNYICENETNADLLVSLALNSPQKFIKVWEIADFSSTNKDVFSAPKEQENQDELLKLKNEAILERLKIIANCSYADKKCPLNLENPVALCMDLLKFMRPGTKSPILQELNYRLLNNNDEATKKMMELSQLYLIEKHKEKNENKQQNQENDKKYTELLLCYIFEPNNFLKVESGELVSIKIRELVNNKTTNLVHIWEQYNLKYLELGNASATLGIYEYMKVLERHYPDFFSNTKMSMSQKILLIRVYASLSNDDQKKFFESVSNKDLWRITLNAKTVEEVNMAIFFRQQTNWFNENSFMRKLTRKDLQAALWLAKEFHRRYRDEDGKPVGLLKAMVTIAKLCYDQWSNLAGPGWLERNTKYMLFLMEAKYGLKSLVIDNTVANESNEYAVVLPMRGGQITYKAPQNTPKQKVDDTKIATITNENLKYIVEIRTKMQTLLLGTVKDLNSEDETKRDDAQLLNYFLSAVNNFAFDVNMPPYAIEQVIKHIFLDKAAEYLKKSKEQKITPQKGEELYNILFKNKLKKISLDPSGLLENNFIRCNVDFSIDGSIKNILDEKTIAGLDDFLLRYLERYSNRKIETSNPKFNSNFYAQGGPISSQNIEKTYFDNLHLIEELKKKRNMFEADLEKQITDLEKQIAEIGDRIYEETEDGELVYGETEEQQKKLDEIKQKGTVELKDIDNIIALLEGYSNYLIAQMSQYVDDTGHPASKKDVDDITNIIKANCNASLNIEQHKDVLARMNAENILLLKNYLLDAMATKNLNNAVLQCMRVLEQLKPKNYLSEQLLLICNNYDPEKKLLNDNLINNIVVMSYDEVRDLELAIRTDTAECNEENGTYSVKLKNGNEINIPTGLAKCLVYRNVNPNFKFNILFNDPNELQLLETKNRVHDLIRENNISFENITLKGIDTFARDILTNNLGNTLDKLARFKKIIIKCLFELSCKSKDNALVIFGTGGIIDAIYKSKLNDETKNVLNSENETLIKLYIEESIADAIKAIHKETCDNSKRSLIASFVGLKPESYYPLDLKEKQKQDPNVKRACEEEMSQDIEAALKLYEMGIEPKFITEVLKNPGLAMTLADKNFDFAFDSLKNSPDLFLEAYQAAITVDGFDRDMRDKNVESILRAVKEDELNIIESSFTAHNTTRNTLRRVINEAIKRSASQENLAAQQHLNKGVRNSKGLLDV